MSNDISARQNLRLLYAVSEELTELSDVLVNGLTIAGQDLAFAFTRGHIDQPIISGFSSVIGDVTSVYTLTTTETVTYTVQATDYGLGTQVSAPMVEVSIIFPFGLYYANKNGDKYDQFMSIVFEVYAPGESSPRQTHLWQKQFCHVGDYKTSTYILRPDSIPATSDWSIKAVRYIVQGSEVASPTGSFLRNKTQLSFISWVNADQMNYAGTALLAIWVQDIELINKSYPQVTFKGKGMTFYVPHAGHYDPITKTYSGTWNAVFTTSRVFTSNPSWIIYNILSDRLIKNIPTNPQHTTTFPYMYSFGVDESDLGLWSFYNFAVYCDSTLHGAPRYEINNQYIEKQSRKDFLNSMLSVCNAKLVRKHGLLCVAWDRRLAEWEIASIPLIAAEGTKAGFEYNDTHVSERYTNVVVVFKDNANSNTPVTVTADSTELVTFLKSILVLPGDASWSYFVDKYGYKTTTIELPGSSNRTTALLKARSVLWDALMGNEFVSFSGGFELASYYEGQVIGIVDNSLSFTRKTGRLAYTTSYDSGTGLATVVFSDEISLSVTSTVYFYLADEVCVYEEALSPIETNLFLYPKPYSPAASNFSLGDTFLVQNTFVFALPAAPIEGSPFFIVDASPAYYTVTAVDFADEVYTITGKNYNLNKFDYIEQVPTRPPVYSLPSYVLPQPTNITPVVSVHQGASTGHIIVELSFDHVLTLTVAQRFAIKYTIHISVLSSDEQVKVLHKAAHVRDAAEIFSGTLDDLTTYDNQSITDALTTTYSLYARFTFSFPNYAQYFSDDGSPVSSIEAPLRIKILPSVDMVGSGVKTPQPLHYYDTITLDTPTVLTVI